MLFPYFGAKSRAAPLIWEYLGDPELYIEPFGGSLAVLLARPTAPRTEIAVDLDGLLVNFWRSIQLSWHEVEVCLSGSIAEIDLRAKHAALIENRDVITDKLAGDPMWCNPMLAAWWWEGISSYLGSGFGHRLSRQRPHIDRSMKGCFAKGMTDEKMLWVVGRLANVILLSGDWEDAWHRSVTASIINRFDKGVGVFLDPPYAGDRQPGLYTEDDPLTARIVQWCLTQPRHVRIVVSGYDDEYPSLAEAGWGLIPWHAHNGYAQERNQRRHKEVLYVRPRVTKKRR